MFFIYDIKKNFKVPNMIVTPFFLSSINELLLKLFMMFFKTNMARTYIFIDELRILVGENNFFLFPFYRRRYRLYPGYTGPWFNT